MVWVRYDIESGNFRTALGLFSHLTGGQAHGIRLFVYSSNLRELRSSSPLSLARLMEKILAWRNAARSATDIFYLFFVLPRCSVFRDGKRRRAYVTFSSGLELPPTAEPSVCLSVRIAAGGGESRSRRSPRALFYYPRNAPFPDTPVFFFRSFFFSYFPLRPEHLFRELLFMLIHQTVVRNSKFMLGFFVFFFFFVLNHKMATKP